MFKIYFISTFLITLGIEVLFTEGKTVPDCQLNALKDVPQPDPLLLLPGQSKFYEPSSDGIIEVKKGETIDLYCDSTFKKFEKENQISAECLEGSTFIVKGKKFTFSDFACKDWQSFVAKPTGKKCAKVGTEIEVGFNLKDSEFVKLYEICHDVNLESTLYVHHWLRPYANNNHKQQIDRIPFKQLDFFSFPKTDSLYTQFVQQKNIGSLLNGNEGKFFDIPNAIYLARGHLNAKTDYIYPSQQRATFLLLNVAPQWQTFNAGNWVAVENGVRKFGGENNLDLEVYSGTLGISTLPDANGKQHELFLNLDPKSKNFKIPVPALYYKVVMDPASKRGIVLIGVNNVHLNMKEIQKDYIICDDISNKVNWINWNPADIKAGYSYACDVKQFQKVVKNLPKLDVKELLI